MSLASLWFAWLVLLGSLALLALLWFPGLCLALVALLLLGLVWLASVCLAGSALCLEN